MKLHTLLKDLRERQRLRVDDVAAMLDCSRSAVYAWESGGKGPAPEHLRALADAYNCTKKDRADLARLSAFGTDEEPDSADVEPPGPTRAASLALAFREAQEKSSKLREENTALRAEVERLQSHAADCEQHAKFATEKATALERAAVVAWLRAGVHHHRGFGFHLIGDELEAYADHIERGEHCREEGA